MNVGSEAEACKPKVVDARGFNPRASLPYGLTIGHLQAAMSEFVSFLGFINQQLHLRQIARLEAMLMPANFSSIVGEMMVAAIPRYCSTLVKNQYHNGHPDLLPRGRFSGDAAQHAAEGIEVKGSRYLKGWQGHNPEDTWLMVFVFDSNRPVDANGGTPPKPFRFVKVVGARLLSVDWRFAGRGGASRRTPTANVAETGFWKMEGNWIYRDPGAIPTSETEPKT